MELFQNFIQDIHFQQVRNMKKDDIKFVLKMEKNMEYNTSLYSFDNRCNADNEFGKNFGYIV